MTLFCPKCGDPLQEVDGRLTYITGDMVLTAHMEEMLRCAYETASGKTDNTPLKFRVGGTWFCPACGESLAEEGGIVGCNKCGRSLNKFVYHLVERHAHNVGART